MPQGLAGAAGSGVPQLPSMLQGAVPPWFVASIRADNSAFIVDTRSPHGAQAGQAKAIESKLPGLVPPTTVFLAEGHDVGAALKQLKAALASDPSLAAGVKQVDDALQLLGGFDAVAGWIDEAGVAITRDGSKVSGGLVMTPTDAAAADRLFSQITGFIQLGGGSSGLSVTSEDYKGTKITTLNLGGLGSMLGGASGGAVQAPADTTLAFAVTSDVVVIGSGADFVKSVLDTKAGSSLADTQRFQSALTQAGTKQASLVWLDVAGVRDLAEAMLPAADRAPYDANLKPYLAGFSSVLGTTTPGDQVDAGTIIISVGGG